MIGPLLKRKALDIFSDSYDGHLINPEDLVNFTENITDGNISKELSYKLLDLLALSNDLEFLSIILKEYRKRCVVFSVNLLEYKDLFSRRIYIPLRYNGEEFLIAIISSLRTFDYEDAYLEKGGIKYTFNGDNKLRNLNVFNIKDSVSLKLVYGKDNWTFVIKTIGLTYYNDNEISMPYLVEDGVGYGIEGISKIKLFKMLDESIELSVDTHNPIMDDEDFEFYYCDVDSLNENAKDDYKYTYSKYINL